MAVGILVVELADENAVDIHRTLVQTRPDPQLQVEVERVVLHRAIGGGVDLRVSAIHRATESRLLRIAAGGGHCEIGERSARPFDRVQVDAAAVDPALHDAVADAGSRQLHDHVGRAGQQRHTHQTLVDTPRPPAPGLLPTRRLGDRLVSCHRRTSRRTSPLIGRTLVS
jgi:hypothetical protein